LCLIGGEDGVATKESELVSQETAKQKCINVRMTSPTITVEAGVSVKGFGLGLIGTPIEQDSAYWEWQIELPVKKDLDTIMFGVSGKKDRKFYTELEDKEHNSEAWMRSIECQDGDVIGVAIQQSDLPMVQFTLNGDIIHDKAVNRFRGTIYPSVFLPFPVEKDLKVTAVLAENKFHHMSPAAKFGPIIVARSIV